jgi:ribosomal protein S6--L-glutamate ligase
MEPLYGESGAIVSFPQDKMVCALDLSSGASHDISVTDKGNSILIITARPTGWATSRFRSAARKRGVPLHTCDPAEVLLEIRPDGLAIRHKGKKLAPPHAVIPRLGPGNYENGYALLDLFEAAGIPVCNTRLAIETAHDTLHTLLHLHTAGLRVPKTARIISIKDLAISQKIIPGPPWILKTYTGAMGIGTMLITKADQLEALAATFWALKQPVLLQELVKSSDDKIADYRAMVIGNKVLGIIRRNALAGEFRANVHRGATPELINPTKDQTRLALKAARASGLGIAGVDWIMTSDGPVVLEVNATPGFKGFESATGIDVAGAMIEYGMSL